MYCIVLYLCYPLMYTSKPSLIKENEEQQVDMEVK